MVQDFYLGSECSICTCWNSVIILKATRYKICRQKDLLFWIY